MSDTKNDSKIGLKSVKEILYKDYKFVIPAYQRGYRWTDQQVRDLLNDIYEFNKGKNEGEFYCLQPLVVKASGDFYEVIDGQQRLTTLYLILEFLGEGGHYEFTYETREDSGTSLKDIVSGKGAGDSIDSFHISNAFDVVIPNWFKGKDKKVFLKKLLDDVNFIWYELGETDNPVEVFTRLNIGKIPLTNAELIKALFLNSSNFHKKSEHLKEDKEDKDRHFRLRQQEIASEWDQIEYTLQNEEFWLFIHNKGYKNPTRIDFIFNLICEKNKEKYGDPGSDEHQTFRYYYNLFRVANKKEDILNKEWNEVKKIFQTFKEWFDDLKLYHYIGYLITISDETRAEEVNYLLNLWDSSKNRKQFIITLKDEIKKRIKIPVKIGKKTEWRCDLSQQYEYDKCPSKRCSRPLLLLHNIQTVINQCKNSTETYGMQVFYKFPFHIYKNEKWDVEHIDPVTPNDLSDPEDQKEWLLNVYGMLKDVFEEKKKVGENPRDFPKEIYHFLNKDQEAKDFKDLKDGILTELGAKDGDLEDDEKNQIMNFALLDSGTNRGYGNAIFAAKRRWIIGKDMGKSIPIPTEGQVFNDFDPSGEKKDNSAEEEESKEKGKSSFVPPSTKQVFLKYYSPTSSNPNSWTEADAEEYKKNIFETLEEFDVIMGEDK